MLHLFDNSKLCCFILHGYNYNCKDTDPCYILANSLEKEESSLRTWGPLYVCIKK